MSRLNTQVNVSGRALFVGRFQPFHNGHLAVINQLLERHNEVIIAIGSAEESISSDNPMTAGERVEMIRRCFPTSTLSRLIIVRCGTSTTIIYGLHIWFPIFRNSELFIQIIRSFIICFRAAVSALKNSNFTKENPARARKSEKISSLAGMNGRNACQRKLLRIWNGWR